MEELKLHQKLLENPNDASLLKMNFNMNKRKSVLKKSNAKKVCMSKSVSKTNESRKFKTETNDTLSKKIGVKPKKNNTKKSTKLSNDSLDEIIIENSFDLQR